MYCSGDENDAAAGAAAGVGVRGFVLGGGCDEVGESGFEGVVGAEDVDVHDGFEGVGAELGDGGEEVAGCAGAVEGILSMVDFGGGIVGGFTLHSRSLQAVGRIALRISVGSPRFGHQLLRYLALLLLSWR